MIAKIWNAKSLFMSPDISIYNLLHPIKYSIKNVVYWLLA